MNANDLTLAMVTGNGDNNLYGRGPGNYGFFGNGTEGGYSTLSKIKNGKWQDVFIDHDAALGSSVFGKKNNKWYAWSKVGEYASRIGALQQSLSPVHCSKVPSGVKLFCDRNNVFYIDDNGEMYAAGGNANGSLGVGSSGAVNEFTHVSGNHFKSVSTSSGVYSDDSYYHSIALDEEGHVWACGSNKYGQLGIGNNTDYNTFQRISGLNNIKYAVAQYLCSFAVDVDGNVFAWGYNTRYQLGNGNATHQKTPVNIGNFNFKKIQMCDFIPFGISESGALYYWGYSNAKVPTLLYANNCIDIDTDSIARGAVTNILLKADGVYTDIGFSPSRSPNFAKDSNGKYGTECKCVAGRYWITRAAFMVLKK